MKYLLIVSIFTLVILSSCSTNRAFTKGEYTDPDRVILLNDKFNESDMKILADALTKSLEESSIIKDQTSKPVFQVETVTNSTSEHIDMQSLTDKIRAALIKTGKVAFHNKQERGTLSAEYEYQTNSGNVSKETAKKRGFQIGSDYILTGNFTSIVQEVGDKEVIYYKLTLNSTNITTGIISWSDEKEVKKLYKKRSISM
ncbi:MAG: penicillin-binding protein activator LpoB [Proteobacteria bacterium]|nr:penicillin-binding protein activator LpoB [Pseudomonadota bacterium]